MQIIFDNITAKECYRLMRRNRALPVRTRAQSIERTLVHASGISRAGKMYGLTAPHHVVTSYGFGRNVNDRIVRHRCLAQLPPGSFCKLDKNVSLVSPEFYIVRMASTYDLVGLIQEIMEVCGCYVITPDLDEGFTSRDPLTSNAQIERFVAKLGKFNGVAQVRCALRWSFDKARSPRETGLVLMLVLPVRLGGYGFPPPVMNCRINVPTAMRSYVSQDYYEADLYWPEMNLDVEYDSSFCHSGADKICRDSRRRIELEMLGLKVKTVTALQVSSVGEMDKLAHQLALEMGLRLRKPTAEVLQRRRQLWSRLLGHYE